MYFYDTSRRLQHNIYTNYKVIFYKNVKNIETTVAIKLSKYQ